MQFIIVTGMSGAGKSLALRFLEDVGFYCVDNLPPTLISKFAEVCFLAQDIQRVALGIDIRAGQLFIEDLFTALKDLEAQKIKCQVLFLEASDEVLLNRYKETRRSHPAAKNERIITGIEKERELLNNVKKHATYVIDTSLILAQQLKEKLTDIFIENKYFDSLMITFLSFGFKYGLPQDSDLVFDVRFLPNPHYIPEFKDRTGLEKPVQDYVLQWDESKVFLEKITDMLTFLIPYYVKEGKHQLVVSIGCTGGKHRSVTLANKLSLTIEKEGYTVNTDHRDIKK